MSIDNLLKQNIELKRKIGVNNEKIAEKRNQLKKVNKNLYQNSDEGLLLIILVIISSIIPPVGVFLPIYIIWRNNKYNSLYKTILFVSLVVILVSMVGTYVILSDNWIEPSKTTVYKVY